MRQPKFLRHLVEKFLLKGDEGNANLQPGIMACWDLQPIGVTRLPISVMRIREYDSDIELDLSGELTEPQVWTSLMGQTSNGSAIFGGNIPAGAIFQFDTIITGALAPTQAVGVEVSVNIAGGGALIWSSPHFFNTLGTGPLHIVSPFMCYQQDVDLSVTVATIDPVGQIIRFATIICLFPNRE